MPLPLLVAATVLVTVASFAVSYNSAKKAKEAQRKALQRAKAVLLPSDGIDESVPVIYGTRRTAGKWVFTSPSNDLPGDIENEALYAAYLLCEGPVESISDPFIDGRSIANIPEYQNATAFRYFTGEDDQPASATLMSRFSGWTSNHRLRGKAYVVVYLRMDRNSALFSGSLPELTFLVKGKKVRDPRLGGDDQPLVWSDNYALISRDLMTSNRYGASLDSEFIDEDSVVDSANFYDRTRGYVTLVSSQLPSVVSSSSIDYENNELTLTAYFYNFSGDVTQQIGYSFNIYRGSVKGEYIGSVQSVYYFENVDETRMRLDSPLTGNGPFVISASRKSESEVRVNTCNFYADTDQDVYDNILTLAAEGRFMVPYNNGKYSIIPDDLISPAEDDFSVSESVDIAVDYGLITDPANISSDYGLIDDQVEFVHITPDEIKGAISIKGGNKRDFYNKAVITFPNKANSYKPSEASWPPEGSQQEVDYLTEDGEELLFRYESETITDSWEAINYAKTVVQQSRTKFIDIQTTMAAAKLIIGSTFFITYPSYGWAKKWLKCEGLSLLSDGGVAISAREIDAPLYDLITSESSAYARYTELQNPLDVAAPTNLILTDISALQEDGTYVTALQIVWTVSANILAQSYEVQWKSSSDSEYSAGVTRNTQFELRSLKDETIYDVRVRGVSIIGGITSDWLSGTVSIGKDTTAPSAPSSVTATGGAGSIQVSWNNPSDIDLSGVEVHVSTSSVEPTDNSDLYTFVLSDKSEFQSFDVASQTFSLETDYYIFLRSFDYAGNRSAFSPSVSAQFSKISIDDTSFSSGSYILTPLEITQTNNTNSASLEYGNPFLCLNGSDDGFYVPDGDTIREYVLSGEMDATSFSAGSSFTDSANLISAAGIAFKTNRTEMYVADAAISGGGKIHQYSLSTVDDITTASHAGFVALPSGYYPNGIVFSPDGETMFVSAYGGGSIHRVFMYSLSTAWDITTATKSTQEIDFSGDLGGVAVFSGSLMLSGDGLTLYVGSRISKLTFIYSLMGEHNITEAILARSAPITDKTVTKSASMFSSDGSKLISISTGVGSVRYIDILNTSILRDL